MPKQAKRKFLDLGVDEVSLVDEPANESPVAVMKRKENEDMTTKATATTTTTPAADQPGVAPTPDTPVAKDASDDVEHVDIAAAEDVIKRLSAAAEALVAKTIDADEVDTEKKAKGKNPFAAKAEEDKAAKKEALKKTLEKAGLKKADIDKAVTAAFGTPTKKDAEGEDTGDTDASVEKAESAMDVLELMGEAISKAKKFTPKRMEELEAVTEKLTGLLADLKGVEKAQPNAALAPDSEGNMPQQIAAPETTTETSTLKSKGDTDLAEAISTAVAKALAPLTEELEAIKKTRTPSTIAPTGTDKGGNKDGSEVKTEKSFWAGVL